MFNHFLKLSSVLAISSLGLFVSPIKPIEAVELAKQPYYYSFSFDIGFDRGSGYIYVYLPDNDREKSYTSSGTYFEVSPFSPPVSFSFPEQIVLKNRLDSFNLDESGMLVGVYGRASQSFRSRDGRYCNDQGGCYVTNGNYSLLLNGAQYTLYYSSYTRENNIFGSFVDRITEDNFQKQGTISFDEFKPIPFIPFEFIPEPLTLLGVATAVSFGTFFKKVSQK